jgi:hypothetical protein
MSVTMLFASLSLSQPLSSLLHVVQVSGDAAPKRRLHGLTR